MNSNTIRRYSSRKHGFTLVEILIVVIILGILAAIVIPQFTNASQDARKSSVASLLQTIRSQVELYKIQHGDQLPDLATGPWTALTGTAQFNGTGPVLGPYLQAVPVNPLNGLSAVTNGTAPSGSTSGWVYDYVAGSSGGPPTGTGKIFATNQTPGSLYDETSGLVQ